MNRWKEDLSGGESSVGGYTYCWVERLKSCEIMRRKGDSNEYFYIPESNIPRIFLTKEQYRKIAYASRIDFGALEKDLVSRGLKPEEAEYLLDNHDLYVLVIRLDEGLKNLRASYNWMVNVVAGISGEINDLFLSELEKVIQDCEINRKISMRMAKELLKEMMQKKVNYRMAIKNLKVTHQISDDGAVKQMVTDAFEKYKDQIEALSKNIPKFERLIIGECMKSSKGQLDPRKTKEFFEELLKLYLPTKG